MGKGTPSVEPRPRDKIDEALKVVEALKASGALGDGAYFKCLVSLAYEYILVEEDQFALVLISKAPVEYYKTVQPQQMEEDPMYGDLVVLLAYKLVQMGVVDGSDDLYPPTMGPANA